MKLMKKLIWGDFNYGGSDTDFLAIAYSIK